MRTFTPIVTKGKQNICYPEITIDKIEQFANRMTLKNQTFYFQTKSNGITETLTFQQLKNLIP